MFWNSSPSGLEPVICDRAEQIAQESMRKTDEFLAKLDRQHLATKARAEYLWIMAGKPEGCDQTFWLEAERQVGGK